MSKKVKKLKLLLIIFFFLPAWSFAQNQEDIKLILDVKGHLSRVWKVFLINNNRDVLTVSEDNTIRFCNIKSHELRKTFSFREERKSKILNASLSNNQKYLAILIYSGSKDKSDFIRIIDIQNSNQVATLTFDNMFVETLKFSQDDQFLITGGNDKTMRIWKLDYNKEGIKAKVVVANKGHEKTIYCLDVNHNNSQIVTGGFDNNVILWNFPQTFGKGVGQKKILKHHKDKVIQVKFSPAGKFIVSSSYDGSVYLWNNKGDFIKELHKFKSMVTSTSFAPNGRRIVIFCKTKGYVVSVPEGEIISTFDKHNNTVLASHFAQNSRIISVGGDNYDVYIWKANSKEIVKHFKGISNNIQIVGVKGDNIIGVGNDIIEPYSPGGPYANINMAFDLEQFKIIENIDKNDFLTFKKIYNGNSLRIDDEGSLYKGNKLIFKKNNEFVISFTYTKSGNIIAGTSRNILVLDNNGKLIKKIDNNFSGVVSVTESPSKDLLISIDFNKIIKFWNIKTHKLLASLFIASNKEWAFWTPMGYYTASPQGEQFLGWLKYRGRDQLPIFYSVKQFQRRFENAAMIKKVLSTQKTDMEIIEQSKGKKEDISALTKGIPILKFNYPSLNNFSKTEFVKAQGHLKSLKNSVNLEFEVTDKGNGVQDILIYHNQKLIEIVTKTFKKNETKKIKFSTVLIDGSNEFKIVATNFNYIESEPIYKSIFYDSKNAKPNLYVLSVGINKYKNKQFDLKYAATDAIEIAQTLKEKKGDIFGNDYVSLLTDENVTKENLFQKLRDLEKIVNKQDILVFFFAGYALKQYNTTYLVPSNFDMSNPVIDSTQLISSKELLLNLKKLRCISLIGIGDLYEYPNRKVTKEDLNIVKFARLGGITLFGTSTSQRNSKETQELKHGILANTFLEVISGKADIIYKDNVVKIHDVQNWLDFKVPKLTKKYRGKAIFFPTYVVKNDFPIATISQ